MSTNQLTALSPAEVAKAVRAVLAGADLTTTATEMALGVDDLADAVEIYQAAGLASLEQRGEAEWFEVRVQFPDWQTAENTAVTHLGPLLDQLQAGGAHAGWWYLRKYPCWRIRLHCTDPPAARRAFNELTAAGVLLGWCPTIYEPETAAFGGPAALRTIHDLFCADSSGVLDYARQDAPPLGRRELSILLLTALFNAAGLDPFEIGDVFDRVARLRPAPAEADATRIAQLADKLSSLLLMPPVSGSPLFIAGGPADFAGGWLDAFSVAGRDLGDAAIHGQLSRGLRAVLTHVVIFHWNRFGLPATTQAILARAASAAMLPGN